MRPWWGDPKDRCRSSHRGFTGDHYYDAYISSCSYCACGTQQFVPRFDRRLGFRPWGLRPAGLCGTAGFCGTPAGLCGTAYLCGPAINSWDRKAAMEAGTTPTPRFLESTVANLQAVGFAPAR